MEDIAVEAGLSLGTLYSVFRGKRVERDAAVLASSCSRPGLKRGTLGLGLVATGLAWACDAITAGVFAPYLRSVPPVAALAASARVAVVCAERVRGSRTPGPAPRGLRATALSPWVLVFHVVPLCPPLALQRRLQPPVPRWVALALAACIEPTIQALFAVPGRPPWAEAWTFLHILAIYGVLVAVLDRRGLPRAYAVRRGYYAYWHLL